MLFGLCIETAKGSMSVYVPRTPVVGAIAHEVTWSAGSDYDRDFLFLRRISGISAETRRSPNRCVGRRAALNPVNPLERERSPH